MAVIYSDDQNNLATLLILNFPKFDINVLLFYNHSKVSKQEIRKNSPNAKTMVKLFDKILYKLENARWLFLFRFKQG